MPDLLDRVEAAASVPNLPLAQADQIAAGAALAKTIAEAKKARADAQTQAKQIHLEQLKSWSTLLVPIASLLTLLATIVIQAYQLHQQLQTTAQQNEDTDWRALITTLGAGADKYASDITVSSRLKTFLSSDRYGEQAYDLTIRVLGNLTNFGTFQELFAATVTPARTNNSKTVLSIARTLSATKNSFESECHGTASELPSLSADLYFGACDVRLSDTNLAGAMRTAKLNSTRTRSLVELRRSYLAVLREADFVGQSAGDVLRKEHGVDNASRSNQPLDLSYITLRGADLSAVDFSSFIMTNTSLEFSKLDKSVLTPLKLDGLEFNDSNWWDVNKIDQNLLRASIQNRYPYYADWISDYPMGDVTKDYYEKRVKALCNSPDDFCNGPLPFHERPAQIPVSPAK
jgi:uncharacterized protein YjbI with pentapeptide repeats